MPPPRMDFAKRLMLLQIIPELDFSGRIRASLFVRSKNKNKCTVIFDSRQDESDKLENISTGIKNPPLGGTPITFAIRQSVEEFEANPGHDYTLILLTDGEENGGGDYEAEIEAARKREIYCEVHIIGLGLNATAEAKAKRVSALTGGLYEPVSLSEPIRHKSTNQSKPNTNTPPPQPLPTPDPGQQAAKKVVAAVNKSQPNPQSIPTDKQPPAAKLASPPSTEQKKPAKESSSIAPQDLPPLPQQVLDLMTNMQTLQAQTQQQVQAMQEEVKALREELAAMRQEQQEQTTARSQRGAATEQEPDEVEIEEDAELNERIRQASEALVYDYLQEQYPGRVTWLNEQEESGKPYDFIVKRSWEDEVMFYVECKGTTGSTPQALLTRNEWHWMLAHKPQYKLMMVTRALKAQPEHSGLIPLWRSIQKGEAVPYALKNEKVKKERIRITLLNYPNQPS